MDLSQLRTLVCVAELGSLSKAADRLCTAQPALSRHIRTLEDELGARLFDRHGRGMVPTEQGRTAIEHAVRVLAELDGLRTSVEREMRGEGGRVMVGLPPSIARLLAAPFVREVRRTRPSSSCLLVSAYCLYLFEQLHGGSLDLAILYDPHSIRSLKSEPLIEETMLLAGAPGTGLDSGEPLAFASLRNRPLVLPSASHSLRQIVEHIAHEVGTELTVEVEADSLTVLKGLVRDGVGWTVLPPVAIADEIAAGQLVAVPLVEPTPRRRLELAYSAERPLTRAAETAREALIATAAGLVASGAWPGAQRAR